MSDRHGCGSHSQFAVGAKIAAAKLEADRNQALSGEWTPWRDISPFSFDYPVELKDQDGSVRLLIERPRDWWSTYHASWRKVPDPTNTVHGEGG